MSLTVLYQYHQDEWYLYYITVITYVSDCTVSVSPRWVIPVLYHRYHLCLCMYCITITKMSDTCTLVFNFRKLLSTLPNYTDLEQILLFSVNWGKQICDNCDRVQVSLILVILSFRKLNTMVSDSWAGAIMAYTHSIYIPNIYLSCMYLLKMGARGAQWVKVIQYRKGAYRDQSPW
jgi:hypothetical protein